MQMKARQNVVRLVGTPHRVVCVEYLSAWSQSPASEAAGRAYRPSGLLPGTGARKISPARRSCSWLRTFVSTSPKLSCATHCALRESWSCARTHTRQVAIHLAGYFADSVCIVCGVLQLLSMAGRRSSELVFRPTLEQVLNTSFEDYIRSIEPQVMRVGIARIVAPLGWSPRKHGYGDVDCLVPRPVRQLATGARGLYRTCLVEERPRHVAGRGGFAEGARAEDAQAPGGPEADVDVRSLALWMPPVCVCVLRSACAPRPCVAPCAHPEHERLSVRSKQTPQTLERAFWKRVTYNPPLYGADVEGSLFDDACPGWHCGHLNTVLQRTLAEAKVHIPGVTSPYLYWGSWRALFAWHTEDYDLYSVNYLHFGAPKTWYAIAPEHRARFETAALSAAPELFHACPEFLRHKELLLSPQLLRSAGVPFTRITQRAREFVITAPGAYHAGFNHGFNCAESTNFATPAWIPVGAKARSCCCQGARGAWPMRTMHHTY